MGRRRARAALLGCLCAFFLLAASPAGAQKVILKNLVVDDSQGGLRLHFGLRALDWQELKPSLQRGNELRLICAATMNRERSLWWDRELQSSRKTFLLRYSSLNEEYRIAAEGSGDMDKRDGDLGSLLDRALQGIQMELGPRPEGIRESELVLHLQIRMVRVDVPFWLKRTLFFWSWDVIPVKEYRIQFRNEYAGVTDTSARL